jgi:hypothetical protein
MEEDRVEKKEQDKPVEVPLEDKKVEKEEVKKCCAECNFSRCWSDFLGRIRSFFNGFSLGCSSTSCVALHRQKTVEQKV